MDYCTVVYKNNILISFSELTQFYPKKREDNNNSDYFEHSIKNVKFYCVVSWRLKDAFICYLTLSL